jgi:hypothetical protein
MGCPVLWDRMPPWALFIRSSEATTLLVSRKVALASPSLQPAAATCGPLDRALWHGECRALIRNQSISGCGSSFYRASRCEPGAVGRVEVDCFLPLATRRMGPPRFLGVKGRRATRPEPASMVSSSTSNVAMSSQMILRQISNLWSARDFFVDVLIGLLARMRVTLKTEYGIGYSPERSANHRKAAAWHYLSHGHA